ncbi:MAG: T9SS type A sorting domain-containing protein [Saprospiraceae bacterium]|nr:T9SS type A sorting domain-containing protein [Saprospiraceae bacterium]
MIKLPLLFLLTLFNIAQIYCQANCSAVKTDLEPINDLGNKISAFTQKMGGLYPNGSNYIPEDHKASGMALAAQVTCLDPSGKADPEQGKIVWLSIGMSNCTQETQRFIPLANAHPGKNPRLQFVDGAQGGQTAQVISAPWHPNYQNFWNTVQNRLSSAGVSAQQVQVIWLKEANQAGNTPPFVHYDSLVVQFRRIARELKTRFPNVKLCYVASRISGRYASTNLNPEPYAYLTGWAVKQLIEDQILEDPELSFEGPNAKSPWLSWGIYMWSDGDIPQKSNPDIFYSCPTDFTNDGVHPSNAGAQKVARLLLHFFTSDSTCTPWFLGNSCQISNLNSALEKQVIVEIFPNPTNEVLNIQMCDQTLSCASIQLFDLHGQCVLSTDLLNKLSLQLPVSDLANGIYYCVVQSKEFGPICQKVCIQH